jgi:hypothetical protein
MQVEPIAKGGKIVGEYKPRQTEFARRRRLNRLVRDLADDLGFERVTIAERAALFQCAALNLQIELMQQAIVRGDAIENDELIRLSSEVRRLLNALRRRSEQQAALRAPPLREREYADV